MRNFLGCTTAGLFVLLTMATTTFAEDPHLVCRHDITPPAGSIVPTLRTPEAPLTFSPFVDGIVAKLQFADFDSALRDLSGENSVLIGGASHTLTTRYSLTSNGQLAWQYAFEYFEALGLQVAYQEYTRSGNALKNIIATIPGQVTPQKVYVIGGHIDSISHNPTNLAPGAEDNGSGSSAVLAAAAALAGESFECTIELVLFSGEEQGLWGSQAYVNDALNGGKQVQAVVNLDMVAYFGNDYGVLIEGGTPWQSLMSNFADAVTNYTSIAHEFSYFSFGSDHVPFQNAGIPAILAIDLDWGEYPHYHSTTDTYDKTTPALGVEIARAALATIAQYAMPLGTTAVIGDGTLASSALRAYPNPAAESVRISFAAKRAATPRTLLVFDAAGRRVRSLESAAILGDNGAVTWDLRDNSGAPVTAGLYWLRAGDDVGRVTVLR